MKLGNTVQRREEYAVVLDFLPNGHPKDMRPSHKKTPIVLAIGKSKFALLELVPKRGVFLQPNKEVYIGDGKREEIHHIVSKVDINRLTNSARKELEYVVKDLIKQNEPKFVEFFNTARPLSTRMHMRNITPHLRAEDNESFWLSLRELVLALQQLYPVKQHLSLCPWKEDI